MSIDDEPVLGKTFAAGDATEGPLDDRIRQLVRSQPYAVLCTAGQEQPYGSLVAYAFDDDLRTAVFATPVSTRKYKLLSENQRVALLVDNRPENPGRMMQVEAITATGRSVEITAGPELERCARMLVARHPHLKTFVAADSCALFRMTVTRFFHVSRFQEVKQWVPGSP